MSETEMAPRRVDSTARVAIQTIPSSPAITTILEDLLLLVSAEISGAQSADEGDALRVRAALLAWDGLGDKARALELLADAEHPLAPSLHLGLGAADSTGRGGPGTEADH